MGVYASIKGDELLTTQMNLKSIILHERSHGKPVLYEPVFMELAKATVWSARLVVAALRWNSGLTEACVNPSGKQRWSVCPQGTGFSAASICHTGGCTF